ncbi:permease [Haliangium sp.]|uniref:permease n=1 Tax=Haliangium sp. TaxID=2663208 RepID=UPI003D0B201D
MFLLVTSVVALVLGPALYRAADAARWALLGLDGFIMITIGGLVVVHIVPHSAAVAGPFVLVVALLGFLGPGWIERHLRRAAQTAHFATLALACFGLMVHAFFDGVALGAASAAHGHDHEGSMLAIAVVLHRLPVAVTIWWLLRPSSGIVSAAAALLGLAVATVCGFGLASLVEPLMDAAWVAYLQALVAGSLLHVVIHRPPPLSAPSSAGRGRFYAGIGALAGVAVVAMLADTHLPFQRVPGEMNFRETFFTLAIESAPALLLGFALAGIIKVYLPHMSVRWMRTGRPASEAARGVAFGLPLPICSCGVVPVYRSLIAAGVPATAAMAFLVATPELGLDAILISLPLLGAELTIARVVAAAVVAFLIGTLIGRLVERRAAAVDAPGPQPATVDRTWARLRQGLRFGLGEVVDDVGPWLLVGLVVASLVEPMISGSWFSALPWGTDVFVFALLGMPTYVCASGATPLVAVLLHKGVSPGAALAFLLAGPATNITTFGILSELHGRRVALAFGAAMAGLAVGVGMLANLLLPGAEALALHESVEEPTGLLPLFCLGMLALLFAASVARMGPRSFIGQVLSPRGDGDDCGDGCGTGHEHGHEHGREQGCGDGCGTGHDHGQGPDCSEGERCGDGDGCSAADGRDRDGGHPAA